MLGIPTPRIYAYSSNSDNPVGAEYIIEERAQGKPLGSLWHEWSLEARLNLVTQLANWEMRLKSVSFQKHGCIYYRQDLEKKGLRIYDLEAEIQLSSGSMAVLDPGVTNDFVFGPLTEAGLWEDERATMNLDRGPCKCFILVSSSPTNMRREHT